MTAGGVVIGYIGPPLGYDVATRTLASWWTLGDSILTPEQVVRVALCAAEAAEVAP